MLLNNLTLTANLILLMSIMIAHTQECINYSFVLNDSIKESVSLHKTKKKIGRYVQENVIIVLNLMEKVMIKMKSM